MLVTIKSFWSLTFMIVTRANNMCTQEKNWEKNCQGLQNGTDVVSLIWFMTIGCHLIEMQFHKILINY